jgi:hypothetical protein
MYCFYKGHCVFLISDTFPVGSDISEHKIIIHALTLIQHQLE